MKTIKQLFLATILLCSTSIFAHDFSNADTGTEFYFNITGANTVEVTYSGETAGLDPYSGNIVIPSTVSYNGTIYTVSSIGDYAFLVNSLLTSAVIPNTVTSIGEMAFSLSGLTSITIPSSVETMGNAAFAYIQTLENISVETGNAHYSVTDGALYRDQTALVVYPAQKAGTQFTVPEGITSIDDLAFMYSTLSNISLPSTLQSIGNWTFGVCVNITSLELPASITSIGENAFMGIPLQKIKVNWTDLSQVTYANNIFTGVNIFTCRLSVPQGTMADYNQAPWAFVNTVEYNPDFIVDENDVLIDYVGTATDLIVPYGVKEIGHGVFQNNCDITSIVMPASVTKIGNSAFTNACSLTSVTIPSSVVYMDNFAFVACEALQEINVSWADPRAVANGGNITYGSGIFSFTPSSCVVNYPSGALAAYQTFPWLYFDNISGNSTSVSATVASQPVIYTLDRNIIVENAEAPVSVYDISGHCIARRAAARHGSTTEPIAVPQAGIYLVRVGSEVQKVMVK